MRSPARTSAARATFSPDGEDPAEARREAQCAIGRELLLEVVHGRLAANKVVSCASIIDWLHETKHGLLGPERVIDIGGCDAQRWRESRSQF